MQQRDPHHTAQIPTKARLIPSVNDLLTLFPHIAQELQNITPEHILATSTQQQQWQCTYCQQHWSASPRSRTTVFSPELGCPDCAKTRALHRRQQNMTLYEMYPGLAQELKAPEHAQNVSYGSHKTLTWICERGHEYDAKVVQRVNGRTCPYCHFRKLLSGFNDLATLFPQLAAELTEPARSIKVLANSTAIMQWQHRTNDGVLHQWEASVKSRTYEHRGCLVCAGKYVQIGVNDFQSFLHTTAYTWCKSNAFKPTNITKGSNKHITVVCEFHTPVNTMSGAAKNFTNGSIRCQDCVPSIERFTSQPERDIAAYLQSCHPALNIEQHVRRFKKHGIYEIDFLVNNWLAIDFNGTYWHQEGVFKPVGYHAQKRHKIAELGFTFLEIEEADWQRDRDAVFQQIARMLRTTGSDI